MALTCKLRNVSERHLTDYVKLCYDYLQKPVQKTISEEGKDGIAGINLALTGLSALESEVINRQSALVRCLIQCWAPLLNWSKAILYGHHFFGAYKLFFSNMTGIFNLYKMVRGSLLENNDVFDFAVDLWKGVEVAGGVEYYMEEALFACLSTSNSRQIDRFQARSGYTSSEIVKKCVNRMENAATSKPRDIEKIVTSVSFLGKLVNFTTHPIADAILARNSKVAATICSNMKHLLDDKDTSPEYLTATRLSLNFLNGYTQGRPENVAELIEHGLLLNLFYAVSTDPAQDVEEISRYIACLQFFLPSVAHERALLSLKDAAFELFGRHPFLKLLQSTHSQFQRAWVIFEAVFLEQMLLYSLFEKGYDRERGACANVSA